MQWKEDTTAGSRMFTGRSAYGIRTTRDPLAAMRGLLLRGRGGRERGREKEGREGNGGEGRRGRGKEKGRGGEEKERKKGKEEEGRACLGSKKIMVTAL